MVHKCFCCHKKILPGKRLIAVYDEKTGYLYYFCSWWHVIKGYVLKWLKRR